MSEEHVIVDPAKLKEGLEALKTSSSNLQKYVTELDSVVVKVAKAYKGNESTQFQNKMKKLSQNYTTAREQLDKVLVSNLLTLHTQYESVISKTREAIEGLNSDFTMQ